MKKDPSRYTPHPYGHAAPWNRPAVPAAAPMPRTAGLAGRWPWVVVAALAVAVVGWLIWRSAAG